MKKILIRGGTLVTDTGRRRADLLCLEGRIAAVGDNLDADGGAEIVDAGGCFVMPGGVDPHTHMQLPMMDTVVADDFFTGTAAAAAGGTTTILDFVGPDHGQSPLDALAVWRERAAKATIDYGFHMTVSWWGERFSLEMEPLVREHGRLPIEMRARALLELGRRHGYVHFADTHEAYETLYGLIVSDMHLRMLLGEDAGALKKEFSPRAEKAVDAFLTLHGAKG